MKGDSPSRLIMEFVSKLTPRAIFCSKDLLQFASRTQLDNITSKLVKCDIIVRLANGVFCRKNKKDQHLPTLGEIVEAKARVFKRRLAQADEDATKMKQLKKMTGRNVLYTTSSSSSMKTIHGRVYYRKLSPRWLKLTSTRGGELLKQVLFFFHRKNTDRYIRTAIQALLPATFCDTYWKDAWKKSG